MIPTRTRDAFAMAAPDLVIYRNPRWHRLFAVLVGAAAGLAIPFVTASHAPAQIVGVIWLGLSAHVLCSQLERAMDRRPVVWIGARGIFDSRVLPRLIEWWEIASFDPLDPRSSRVVELRLRDPHRTLADAPWYVRLGLDWPLPHVCISLLLLDGSVCDVIEAIRLHAPYLVPRIDGVAHRKPAQVQACSDSRRIG